MIIMKREIIIHVGGGGGSWRSAPCIPLISLYTNYSINNLIRGLTISVITIK